MRRDAQHRRKQAQEMVRDLARQCARASPGRSLLRLRVEPERGFHHAATVAGDGIQAGGACAATAAAQRSRANSGPASSSPISLPPSAAACASSPNTIASDAGGTQPACQSARPAPIDSARSGREGEHQAFVAADMVLVSAHVLVARPAEQDRAGNQFEGLAAIAITETTAAHIGDQERLMLLGIGGILRAAAAPVVGGRDRFGLHQGDSRHRSCSSRWANLNVVIRLRRPWTVNRLAG